uniref:Uncharacterized protein n=1 Tax=Picea glauca TaxID=3330 RepID=A0A117NFN3_PICGL|nr:hypothetical protein ABT39_MTgene2634 [Picea glauca]QHR88107.1 hypothetical protein Q903MT_gene2120 [Picea sitchensis]
MVTQWRVTRYYYDTIEGVQTRWMMRTRHMMRWLLEDEVTRGGISTATARYPGAHRKLPQSRDTGWFI